MTTLLALFRRPDGGDEALAEFERAYARDTSPAGGRDPGLRAIRCQRVVQGLGGRRTSS